jgi:molybdate transport system substrate-binding protein
MCRLRALVLAGLVLGLGACGDGTGNGAPPSDGQPVLSGRATVFAAATLADAFEAIGDAFTAANPEAAVTFSFAGSSSLAQQILEGAPADVFASADEENMARLTDNGATATDPVVFATNEMVVAVPPGNPLGIAGLADLARPDVALVVCAEQVPCGRFAAEILDGAGVDATPRSYEENVRAVLTKVELGEADAGIVYASDVQASAGGVDGVPVPEEQNVVARLTIAATVESRNPDVAAAFVDFVTGEQGQAVLRRFGFGPP